MVKIILKIKLRRDELISFSLIIFEIEERINKGGLINDRKKIFGSRYSI